MAVPIQLTSNTPDIGTPVALFPLPIGGAVQQGDARHKYMVSMDSRQFLVATVKEDAAGADHGDPELEGESLRSDMADGWRILSRLKNSARDGEDIPAAFSSRRIPDRGAGPRHSARPLRNCLQIGVGGMGEVYRATDTNLKRTVAIKVLPEAVASDGERLARFQREAEVLARLNHPNIAAIYGLEKSDGTAALVMELVEGPTLADRIAQGPIPVDDVLPIARQIAEALETAHEHGIIHRDLKPSNIKLRPDGAVKVLDFGLAKAMDGPLSGSSSVSMSPTITTPAMTQAGVILGTAAYMSPEQVKGKPTDRRADIWAFGVVLYEMFTGRQLFTGETAAEILAGVMKDEPRFDTIPADVRPIVERCLRRDLRRRWQAMGDVRIALEEGIAAAATVPASLPLRFWARVPLAWIVGSLAIAVASVLAVVYLRETPPTPRTVRFQVPPPEKAVITSFTLSPDGRYLAFVAGRQIWLRPIDSLDARALPGTDGVAPSPDALFWSPDSTFLGFTQPRPAEKDLGERRTARKSCRRRAPPQPCQLGSRGCHSVCARTGRPNPASAGGRWRARRGHQARRRRAPHGPTVLARRPTLSLSRRREQG